MRDPIRRKLDAHAARHVPATADLWPALRRRVAAQPRTGGHRRVRAGLRVWAGAAATIAFALVILVLAAALFSVGGHRAASGGAPVPALAVAPRAVATAGGTPTRSASTPSGTPATPGAGCDDAAVTALVARFLDAYNAGDPARLLAFFPAQAATRGVMVPGEERYFQRYWDVRKPTLRDEDGFAAYTRDELPPYWAQRHAQHERLQLRQLEDGGRDWTGGVGIGFTLTRQADDLSAHTVIGKGEIDCARGTIFVWSMGPQEQPATPTPAYAIPAAPDPRYRAPDLPAVTPQAAPGIPWIAPRDPGAAPGQPAITEEDVRAVALTAGHWPDQFRPVGPTTVASVEFLSHAAVEPRVGGHLSPTVNDELCLVKLAGGFTRPAPDPGATGPQGQPVTSQHLYLLFDARTGNFLMLYQPSPNMDK